MTTEPESASSYPPVRPPVPPRTFQVDPRLKSPILATLLSLMPGLGQAYLGYVQLGFVNALVIFSLITLLANDAGAMTPLVALFMSFYWLFNVVDANRRAILLNQKIQGLAPGELPEDLGPGIRGSVAGGLVLIVAGVLGLAHLRFGLSLAWVKDWWPAALILGGIYLVWKAVRKPQ